MRTPSERWVVRRQYRTCRSARRTVSRTVVTGQGLAAGLSSVHSSLSVVLRLAFVSSTAGPHEVWR